MAIDLSITSTSDWHASSITAVELIGRARVDVDPYELLIGGKARIVVDKPLTRAKGILRTVSDGKDVRIGRHLQAPLFGEAVQGEEGAAISAKSEMRGLGGLTGPAVLGVKEGTDAKT